MTKKLHFLLPFVFFIILVCFGFLVTNNWIDPDFGWHLKTGQLILEKGVPYTDWYSYTMPNFPWINHEWLTDILIYKFYSTFGFNLLLLIFLCIYTLSFFIVNKKSDYFIAIYLPITLAYFATTSFLGIRPQLLTIFFVVILSILIEKFLNNSSKLFYIAPFIFIVWANLHAGFFVGIVILIMVIFLEIFKKTRIWEKVKILNFLYKFNLEEQPSHKLRKLIFILFLSFAATFINPYGWHIYIELFRTVGDNFIRYHIAEWRPLFLGGFNPVIYIYIGFFISLILKFFKKVNFNDLIISIFFLLLTIVSIRYFLIFVIWTIPMFINMVDYMIGEYNWRKVFSSLSMRHRFASSILIIILIFFILASTYKVSQAHVYYSENAVSFLKTLPLSENIFNSYGWGGYIIWKLPERKIFIDGRMAIWRENGNSIFEDYIKVTKAEEGFETIIEKYNINIFILDKSSIRSKSKLNNSTLARFLINHPRLAEFAGVDVNEGLYEKLSNLHWKTIYEDDVALILKK